VTNSTSSPTMADAGPLAPAELQFSDWLWDRWLAAGRLHLLVGPGKLGSLFCCDIAARLSTGGRWPDRSRRCRPADVLVYSTADTTRRQLDASGADPERVHSVIARPDPNLAISELDELLRLHREVRLLIADPLTALLQGNSTLRTWTDLAAIAARHFVAVIATCEKAAEFSAAANVVLRASEDARTQDVSIAQRRNILTATKSRALTAQIINAGSVSRLTWRPHA